MAKILVTPVASSGIAPYVEEGELKSKYWGEETGLIYYINDSSYPAEIVTVLED